MKTHHIKGKTTGRTSMDIFRVSRGQIFQANPLNLNIVLGSRVKREQGSCFTNHEQRERRGARGEEEEEKQVRAGVCGSFRGRNQPAGSATIRNASERTVVRAKFVAEEREETAVPRVSVLFMVTRTHTRVSQTHAGHTFHRSLFAFLQFIKVEDGQWTAMC